MGCFLSCFQVSEEEYDQIGIEIDNVSENYSDNDQYNEIYEDAYPDFLNTVYRRRLCTYD